MSSNCCGAAILSDDGNGHGLCAECKEGCVVEEEEEEDYMETWLLDK